MTARPGLWWALSFWEYGQGRTEFFGCQTCGPGLQVGTSQTERKGMFDSAGGDECYCVSRHCKRTLVLVFNQIEGMKILLPQTV